ncbi:MAG: hypothetical protein ABSC22_13015 [Roseiarcus sp.]|jgi:hypothetical protein
MRWVAAGCAVFLLAPVYAAHAFELVTEAEAALPAGEAPALIMRGSPMRRPNILVVSPPPTAGLMHSPIDLKLRFHAFGGAEIDPESVVVTYLKQPAIDITQRIAPFITAQGVEIDKVEVPAGAHRFWIELKDKSGHVGAAEVSFQIAK